MCTQFNPLQGYFPNEENSNSMNEYRGFKVGDKVEITKKPSCWTSGGGRSPMNEVYPIRGAISNIFNDDYCPTATINGFGFDIQTLVKEKCIKKLPKYAVGDVVREKISGKIYEVTMVLGRETYRSGDVCFLENTVEPFDGFRIGDTVWTVKRGKGKIGGERYGSNKRPFEVDFGEAYKSYKSPKLTNLIPTESLYKEALNKTGYAFKIDVAYVSEWNPIMECVADIEHQKKTERLAKIKAAGEAFYQAAKNMAAAIGRTTDQIKFPSGGVVSDTPRMIFAGEPYMVPPKSPSLASLEYHFAENSKKLQEIMDEVKKKKDELRKLTFTRSAKGHLEVVDGNDGSENKYRCSKFAVHELVSYAGCIRAVVDRIHFKDGKFTYDLRTNSCPDGVSEDSLIAVVPAAKFKNGDTVYYPHLIGGTKWSVITIHTYENNGIPYKIMYDLKSDCGDRKCTVLESNLRLWKETTFKYAVGYRDGKKPKSIEFSDISAEELKRVKHLGKNTFGDDVFCFTSTIGVPIILLGTKGDDII
jgi:hypothetical protein